MKGKGTIMAISQRFLQTFSDSYLSDDVDRFMQLVDSECEWVIMATGESFRGADQVRQLAERSIAARKHTPDIHIELTNQFWSEDQMCLEYVHRAIVTAQWPSSHDQPPVGTKIDIKIALVCHIKNDKLTSIHEYFDLGQVLHPDKVQHLYS